MSRRKVTIQAQELTEMDVERISLVKRGANRVPFRIIKSQGDNSMSQFTLSLTKLFQKDAASVEPTLVAIALSKSADVELVTTALVGGGFEIDHVVEGEEVNSLMLVKGDDLEGLFAIKINDDCAVLIKDFEKGLSSWPDSNSFVENITTAGFAPSFRLANEILSETVSNIMYSEGDAEVTKSGISKAMNDFQGYVEAVMETIPVQAFKAENILIEVEKGMLNAVNTGTEDKDATADATADAVNDTAMNNNIAANTAGEAEQSEGEGEGTTGDEVAQTDTAPEETQLTNMAEQMTAMLKSMTEFSTTIGTLSETVASVKSDSEKALADIRDDLKKTDEALEGTTLSGDPDDVDSASLQKSNADEWDGILDFGGAEQI